MVEGGKAKKGGQKRRGRPRPPALPPPPLTEGELGALFDDCNRTRFGGRLPKARVSWNTPPDGLVASLHPTSALGPSIWISPIWSIGMDKSRIREILLHEMCHLEVAMEPQGPEEGHAPRWIAAMRRLHRQGERWVVGNLNSMARAEAERARLREPMLREMARLDPSLPPKAVRRILLRKYGKRRGREFGISGAQMVDGDAVLWKFWFDRYRGDRQPGTRGEG